VNSFHQNDAARARARLVLLLTIALFAGALAFAFTLAPAADAASSSAGSGGTGSSSDTPSAQASKYETLWSKVTQKDRQWARSTAECESGGDPQAIGGGGQFRGAFQFMKSTWKSAPKSPGGDPIDYSYKTQAVVAVALKNRDGAGHWPNCG
jgi:soluble lytic murein transglycosylase-like protein